MDTKIGKDYSFIQKCCRKQIWNSEEGWYGGESSAYIRWGKKQQYSDKTAKTNI